MTVRYLPLQVIPGMEGCEDQVVCSGSDERSLPQGVYETLGK